MIVKVARRQFTVDEYHRMAEAGILGREEKVELLEGDVWAHTFVPSSSRKDDAPHKIDDGVHHKVARRQFSVDEYYRMAEAGILGVDDRVELIEGEIVEMPPIGSHHAGVVNSLTRLFSNFAADRFVVTVQNPVHLAEFSEPQPDMMLLRPRADLYREAHPTPLDVLLLIEVAGSSLEYDRQVKLGLYARAGIVEVWIVDLAASNVMVYTQPSIEGYTNQHVAARGATVAPVSLPDLHLAVDDILG